MNEWKGTFKIVLAHFSIGTGKLFVGVLRPVGWSGHLKAMFARGNVVSAALVCSALCTCYLSMRRVPPRRSNYKASSAGCPRFDPGSSQA